MKNCNQTCWKPIASWVQFAVLFISFVTKAREREGARAVCKGKKKTSSLSEWRRWKCLVLTLTSWILQPCVKSFKLIWLISDMFHVCQLAAKDICWAMSQQSIRVWLQIDSEAACVCVRQTPRLQRGIIHPELKLLQEHNSEIITAHNDVSKHGSCKRESFTKN